MEALILSCGGTINPLIKSIIKYNPDLIYFLHSEDSFSNVIEILSIFNVLEKLLLFNLPLNYKFKLIKEYQDIEKVFSVSKEIISELQDDSYDIIVDFTGGTKPMSGGLVLASIGQKCKYYYTGTNFDEGREKDGVGAVKDGFEFAIEQDDPYDSYAIFEFNKGKTFFDEYQFKAAKMNFDGAINKSKSDDLKKLARIYSEIVNLYDLWDKFDVRISRNVMLFKPFKRVLNEIKEDEFLNNDFSKKYPSFLAQIEDNIKFLEMKISKNKKVTLENIYYYLPDLLNNAKRRIDEGKYDDAVARLYRAIELIAQIKLTREGFINDETLSVNKKFKIEKSKILELSNELLIKYKMISSYEFNKESDKNSFGIASKKSYILLDGLGFDFANKYLNDKKIKKNIELRNDSILAHGLNPIIEDQANELYKQVLEYAKYICPNVEEIMQKAKFPKFNDE